MNTEIPLIHLKQWHQYLSIQAPIFLGLSATCAGALPSSCDKYKFWILLIGFILFFFIISQEAQNLRARRGKSNIPFKTLLRSSWTHARIYFAAVFMYIVLLALNHP